jgi:hypothetical protein
MKFDFNQHFGVFIGTSPNTLFRLNVSALDGTDVLANDIAPLIEFVDFTEYCTEVMVSNGVTAVGTTIDLGMKTGTLVFSAEGSDPFAGYFVKVNSPIKLVLKGYPSGGSDTDWFYGFVKDIQRDTDANGITRVVITLGDQIEQLMSFETTISEIADQTFEERWADIDLAFGTSIANLNTSRTTSTTLFPGIDIFETALGDTILETMLGELGWLMTTRFDVIVPMSRSYLATELAGAHKYEIKQEVTGSMSGIRIPATYINVSSSSADIVSTINASLTWDPGTVITMVDTDQADLYGNSTLDIELNLADETNLSRWATYALTLTGNQNIKSISVDGLNHKNMHLHEVYEMEPAECVLVNVQANGISVNENYLISKVTHMITPETWQTDLELWRN